MSASAISLTQQPVPLRWRSLGEEWSRRTANQLTLLAFLVLAIGTLFGGRAGETISGLFALAVCLGILRVFVRAHAIASRERRWLTGICQVALAIRVVTAVALYCGPWDPNFLAPDQEGYDLIPQAIARSWAGSARIYSVPDDRIGYLNLVALQYWSLGVAPIVPRVFNALAGALIVFYTFLLSQKVFGTTEAKVTALWAAVFPSLILWASLNMRDIWMALSVLVILWHAVRLREALSFGSTFFVVAHLIWLQYTRPYLVLVMSGAVLVTVLLARKTRLSRDIAVAIAAVALLFLLHNGLGIGRDSVGLLDPERLTAMRAKMASASVGDSGYLEKIDISSPVAAATALPLLLVYFLLTPFPWELTKFSRLITLPEMIVWYWLIPKIINSARRALGDTTRLSTALLFSTLVITVAYAIGTSNMGLAYRYRVQVIAPYLALGAAAFVRERAEADGLDRPD